MQSDFRVSDCIMSLTTDYLTSVHHFLGVDMICQCSRSALYDVMASNAQQTNVYLSAANLSHPVQLMSTSALAICYRHCRLGCGWCLKNNGLCVKFQNNEPFYSLTYIAIFLLPSKWFEIVFIDLGFMSKVGKCIFQTECSGE